MVLCFMWQLVSGLLFDSRTGVPNHVPRPETRAANECSEPRGGSLEQCTDMTSLIRLFECSCWCANSQFRCIRALFIHWSRGRIVWAHGRSFRADELAALAHMFAVITSLLLSSYALRAIHRIPVACIERLFVMECKAERDLQGFGRSSPRRCQIRRGLVVLWPLRALLLRPTPAMAVAAACLLLAAGHFGGV